MHRNRRKTVVVKRARVYAQSRLQEQLFFEPDAGIAGVGVRSLPVVVVVVLLLRFFADEMVTARVE